MATLACLANAVSLSIEEAVPQPLPAEYRFATVSSPCLHTARAVPASSMADQRRRPPTARIQVRPDVGSSAARLCPDGNSIAGGIDGHTWGRGIARFIRLEEARSPPSPPGYWGR